MELDKFVLTRFTMLALIGAALRLPLRKLRAARSRINHFVSQRPLEGAGLHGELSPVLTRENLMAMGQ